jgi:hypothetical protein
LLAAKELAAALDEDVTGIRVLEVPVPRDSRRELAASIDAAARRALGTAAGGSATDAAAVASPDGDH